MAPRNDDVARTRTNNQLAGGSHEQSWRANFAWFFARPWVAPAVGLIAILMLVLPQALGALVKANVQIGWDAQDYKCLPFSLYLFKMESTRPADVSMRRGAMVVFRAHDGNTGISRLDGIRMVKIVAGIPGDRLVVKDDFAYINGAPWGRLTLLGTLQKGSGSLDRDVYVPPGKVLLLGTTPYSYDGRYYGFIDQVDIEAEAIPVF